MTYLLNVQAATLEKWRLNVRADSLVVDIFRVTFELARELHLPHIDPFLVLCNLAGVNNFGKNGPSMDLGLKRENLLAWLRSSAATEIQRTLVSTDSGPLDDMLQAIDVYNVGLDAEYRFYGLHELAIGVFASNSQLVKLYCAQTYKSPTKWLDSLGVSREVSNILLQSRHREKRSQLERRTVGSRRR
ncbi:MAG: hypothetical protein V4611_03105 [Patescibacteria group bacterium]